MENRIRKYPRTPHLQGSRLQPGDEDLSQIPFSEIAGRYIVLEEKIDGANSAISFSDEGQLMLQSRGHYLTGGPREKHYDLMKQWAAVHSAAFRDVLGHRYIMYGEWMYAKHAIYYDRLPHYFMEFDIYDREEGIYLDTPSRHALVKSLPICSVSVLASGRFTSTEQVLSYLGASSYISDHHLQDLYSKASAMGLDADRILRETADTNLMEGIYIKVEEDGQVVDRMKYVRADFLQSVDEPNSHWLDRPIVPNGIIADMTELFSSEYNHK